MSYTGPSRVRSLADVIDVLNTTPALCSICC